jgi:2-dehydro-3-deoxyphosphooctonate aldolase (KDO 8-P synthase)
MADNIVKAGKISIGQGSPLVLISGPCVIENYEMTFKIASFLKALTDQLNIPFIFKASYDKANRTSIHSFRGPGLMEGLNILKLPMHPKFSISYRFLLFCADKPT